MMDTETIPAPAVVLQINVLSREQYKALEAKLLYKLSVNEATTPIQAGVAIGVESVLRLLREGFTRD